MLKRLTLLCLLLLASVSQARAASADVVIYGATPAGIAAAINAAKHGRTVALVDPTPRIGGLVTSGLSYSDFLTLESLGGTFRDYMRRVEAYYVEKYGADSQQAKDSFFGAHAEPHVSLEIFSRMLKEQPRIQLFLNHRLETATTAAAASPTNKRITSARFRHTVRQASVDFSAQVFIDATYEGDLAAAAKAAYRVGRESTREHGERLAGVLYQRGSSLLPGSTGVADKNVQTYNFRVTMTKRPEIRVPVAQPASYRREEFTHVLKDFKSGRITKIFLEQGGGGNGILQLMRITNGKADVNDLRAAPIRLSVPPEQNDYPEGDAQTRERIVERHRDYTLGLIYFLQNDDEIPAALRREASEWGLAGDEFTETNNFPPRLYIREARRIIGEYVFTEHDALMGQGTYRTPLHTDSIAIGDYVLNCHGEQQPGPLHPDVTEGAFVYETLPFQIPYGVIVPKHITNLLVPVAVSASHVGYSALRLEAVYTAMGQAAGLGAHLAIKRRAPVSHVPIDELQEFLHESGAKTIYASDVEPDSQMWRAVQYFGTRGLFHLLIDLRTARYQGRKHLYGLQYFYAFAHHAAELDKPADKTFARHAISLLGSAEKRAQATADAALRPDDELTRGDLLTRLYRYVGK